MEDGDQCCWKIASGIPVMRIDASSSAMQVYKPDTESICVTVSTLYNSSTSLSWPPFEVR